MSVRDRRVRASQAKHIRVERRYAPDVARQAQALLRLLVCPSGGAAAGQHNEDGERLDEVIPECEGDDND
jgi:hypothetical protein